MNLSAENPDKDVRMHTFEKDNRSSESSEELVFKSHLTRIIDLFSILFWEITRLGNVEERPTVQEARRLIHVNDLNMGALYGLISFARLKHSRDMRGLQLLRTLTALRE